MIEPGEPQKLARCPRCRYATAGLESMFCPECGASVMPAHRDGYTTEGVRHAVCAAVFVSGVNVTVVLSVALSAWYITFLMILGVCIFVQIGCFLLTSLYLPAWAVVREDYEVRRWVVAGFWVNIVGFAGCLAAVFGKLAVGGVM